MSTNPGSNNSETTGANEPNSNSDQQQTILGRGINPIAQQQDNFYVKVGDGILGAGDAPGSGKLTYGTDSMFNPFYVFRYAKYGAIAGETYDSDLHKDITEVQNILKTPESSPPVKTINAQKVAVSNPSASEIIKWAADRADDGKETTVAPYPYQWNDFLWCKWYGKIPNNRLLTLRRYPIPVEDNLQVAESKGPLIPIAQAVTWWGGETDNKLDSVLGLTWGLKWLEKTAGIQDIQGNEISSDALLTLAGISDPSLKKLLLAGVLNGSENPYAGTGYDDKVKTWIEQSYSNGPYWNRVRGPINIIDKTLIRDAGYNFNGYSPTTGPIKLNFVYKLRTFNNINPKIAMLDLITNFLALTYNKAEFWGGGIRYFQKTGYVLPGLNTALFEQGDFIGGIQEVLSQVIGLVQKAAGELGAVAGKVAKGVSAGDLQQVAESLSGSKALQNSAANWIKDLMQAPLSIRSFLDGRAVGEWHLTVGNPMNPVAVIGNLCLQSTTISFSDSLGADDFPTEIKFTVNLSHGRPRAKQDIESMFNLGAGDMSFTAMPPPSSAFNSYGERNSVTLNNFKKGRNDTSDPNTAISTGQPNSSQLVAETIDIKTNAANVPGVADAADYFKVNVARAYGIKFAKSNALPDYFVNLKTKD